MTDSTTPIAVVTGGSRGLGLATVTELVRAGWHVVTGARDIDRLIATTESLPPTSVTTVPGDIADPAHRAALAAAAAERGNGASLVIHNASELGPSPMPSLANYPIESLERVYAVNVFAPLALTQLLLPQLRANAGRVVAISSDAAIEPYAGWGGYGPSKAALDHLTAIFAAEHPELRVYSFDPGDMNTAMHQAAFPGEDISDRPDPATVVPALLRLLDADLPSGRYRGAELTEAAPA
ncbi:MAG: SDR family NAD(P)-dependent oxidoreductase [Actinophytocola sp.]|nr:SDR family NAD(P)-dependent oxidoreductase [Actinophytocola sp.]